LVVDATTIKILTDPVDALGRWHSPSPEDPVAQLGPAHIIECGDDCNTVRGCEPFRLWPRAGT